MNARETSTPLRGAPRSAAGTVPTIPAILLAAFLSGGLRAQAPEIFSPGSTSSAPAPSASERTLRSRAVAIDFGLLEEARAALTARPTVIAASRAGAGAGAGETPPAPRLRFNFFDDAPVTVVVERTARTFSGGYSLTGRPAGQPFGQAALVVNGAVVSGAIRVPGDDYRIFRIRSLGDPRDPRYLVSEVTEPPFVCDRWDEEAGGRGAPLPASSAVAPSTATASVIDIALVYSRQLKKRLGGDAQAVTKIEEMIASTNLMFTNSGVSAVLNLVAVEAADYDETGQLSDAQRLLRPDDGHLDEVHALRDRVHADVYGLIRDACCGHAQVLTDRTAPNAWRAVLVSFDVDHVFAHELGHVMGLRHDRHADCGTTCPSSVTKDAFGYVNQALFEPGQPTTKPATAPHQDKQWRTNMARFDQCLAANYAFCHVNHHFSNPDILYSYAVRRTGRRNPDQEEPMGIALTDENADVVTPDGPANAARVLNLTRDYVAGYRAGRAVKVSFDVSTADATEGGAAASIGVSLDAAPGRSLSIPFAVAGFKAWPHDYGVSGALSFGAADTAATLTVTATDDAADDDGETVALTFGDLPNGVSTGAVGGVTVSLIDDDTVSGGPEVDRLAFLSSPADGDAYGAGEDIEAMAVFTKSVAVTGAPTLELRVGVNGRQADCDGGGGEVLVCSYRVVDGDNDANGVSIAANSLGLPQGAAIRDAANQDADLTHSAVGDAPNQVVKTSDPVVTLGVAPDPVPEGSSATVTAVLSAALSGSAAIPLTVVRGTAEAGDYTAPGNVSIAAGALSGVSSLPTAVDADLDDETLTVGLGALPPGLVAGTPSRVTVTIADATAEVTLAASPNPVTEGSPATVTATLSKAVASKVTIPLATTAGSAEAGDYSAPSSVNVAAGETSGAVSLPTARDLDLDDETLDVALGAPLPPLLVAGTPSRVTVTIADATPEATLGASPNPVVEGSSATVEVALSKPWGVSLTIPLLATATSAEAGDYAAPSSRRASRSRPAGLRARPRCPRPTTRTGTTRSSRWLSGRCRRGWRPVPLRAWTWRSGTRRRSPRTRRR